MMIIFNQMINQYHYFPNHQSDDKSATTAVSCGPEALSSVMLVIAMIILPAIKQ
jgi:hypothetical protein